MRKVALVTGGARRIGAALVESFAARGYDVCLHHAHATADAAALAAALEAAHGVRVHVVQEDLTDPSAPARLVNAASTSFGRLDVVVSSASLLHATPFEAVTPDQWEATAALNLRAPFFLLQAAAPVITEGGCFIQIGDHLARETGAPHFIPHQVTKSALTQLVRTTADLFAPQLRVNAVEPGLVLAPEGMAPGALRRFLQEVPLGRAGTPDDVVHAVHYLVEAPYVTGVVLTVDGGRHLRRSNAATG